MKPIKAPPLLGISAWVHSSPINLAELNGQTVLLHFWSYTDIACRQTLLALKKLHEHYGEKLVIIGVHTPQFNFEGIADNVESACDALGINWPVAIDSERQTWHAYHNHYWPRYYLISPEGNIVWDHIGDGGEYELESAIRTYLSDVERVFVNRRVREYSALTPDTYCGRRRNSGLGGTKACTDGVCSYEDGSVKSPGVIYPSGTWEQKDEYLQSAAPKSALQIAYIAEQAFVTTEAPHGEKIRVYLDDKPVPSNLRGKDIKEDTQGTYLLVTRPDTYHLIEGPAEAHTLSIEGDIGTRFYRFSFC